MNSLKHLKLSFILLIIRIYSQVLGSSNLDFTFDYSDHNGTYDPAGSSFSSSDEFEPDEFTFGKIFYNSTGSCDTDQHLNLNNFECVACGQGAYNVTSNGENFTFLPYQITNDINDKVCLGCFDFIDHCARCPNATEVTECSGCISGYQLVADNDTQVSGFSSCMRECEEYSPYSEPDNCSNEGDGDFRDMYLFNVTSTNEQACTQSPIDNCIKYDLTTSKCDKASPGYYLSDLQNETKKCSDKYLNCYDCGQETQESNLSLCVRCEPTFYINTNPDSTDEERCVSVCPPSYGIINKTLANITICTTEGSDKSTSDPECTCLSCSDSEKGYKDHFNTSIAGCATCNSTSCLTCESPYPKRLPDSFMTSNISQKTVGQICTTDCSAVNYTDTTTVDLDDIYFWDNSNECTQITIDNCKAQIADDNKCTECHSNYFVWEGNCIFWQDASCSPGVDNVGCNTYCSNLTSNVTTMYVKTDNVNGYDKCFDCNATMEGCNECNYDNGTDVLTCTKANEKYYINAGNATSCNCGGSGDDAGDCNTNATSIECQTCGKEGKSTTLTDHPDSTQFLMNNSCLSINQCLDVNANLTSRSTQKDGDDNWLCIDLSSDSNYADGNCKTKNVKGYCHECKSGFFLNQALYNDMKANNTFDTTNETGWESFYSEMCLAESDCNSTKIVDKTSSECHYCKNHSSALSECNICSFDGDDNYQCDSCLDNTYYLKDDKSGCMTCGSKYNNSLQCNASYISKCNEDSDWILDARTQTLSTVLDCINKTLCEIDASFKYFNDKSGDAAACVEIKDNANYSVTDCELAVNATGCQKCKTGKYLLENDGVFTCVDCDQESQVQYTDTYDVCLACSDNVHFQNAAQCKACDLQKCKDCNAGYKLNLGDQLGCVPCDTNNTGCSTCEGNTEGGVCTGCKADYFFINDECKDNATCYALAGGYFSKTSDNTCQQCSTEYVSDNCETCNETGCVTCNSSTNYTWLTTNFTCVDPSSIADDCIQAQYNEIHMLDCDLCNVSSSNPYLKLPLLGCLSDCGEGYYADETTATGTNHTCEVCSADCKLCTDGSTCTECNSDFYLFSNSTDSSVTCKSSSDCITDTNFSNYPSTIVSPNKCDLCSVPWTNHTSNISINDVDCKTCKEVNFDSQVQPVCLTCDNSKWPIFYINTSEWQCIAEAECTSNFTKYDDTQTNTTLCIKCSDKIDNCEECNEFNGCSKCVSDASEFHVIDRNNGTNASNTSYGECIAKSECISDRSLYPDTSTTNCLLCADTTANCDWCKENSTCLSCENTSYALGDGVINIGCIQKEDCDLTYNHSFLLDANLYGENDTYCYPCNDTNHGWDDLCKSCNQNKCTECEADYALWFYTIENSTNFDCFAEASCVAPNLFLRTVNASECHNCTELNGGNCLECNGDNNCTKCNESDYHLYKTDSDNQCIDTASCVTTKFARVDDDIQRCHDCDYENANCTECTNATQCTQCVDLTYYLYTDTNVSCKLCSEAIDDCIECSDNVTCTKCSPQFFLKTLNGSTTCVDQTNCEGTKKYLVLATNSSVNGSDGLGTCKLCTDFGSIQTNTQCVACARVDSSVLVDEDPKCEGCLNNTWVSIDQTQCLDFCQPQKMYHQGSNVEQIGRCYMCDAGPNGKTNCDECNFDGTECTKCKDTYVLNANNSCNACDSITHCVECDFIEALDQHNCTNCGAKWYNADSNTCDDTCAGEDLKVMTHYTKTSSSGNGKDCASCEDVITDCDQCRRITQDDFNEAPFCTSCSNNKYYSMSKKECVENCENNTEYHLKQKDETYGRCAICQDKQPDCLECDFDTGNCTKCADGKVVKLADKTCVENCEAGEFIDSDGFKCVDSCQPSEYEGQNDASKDACILCSTYHSECATCNSSQCLTCNADYYIYQGDNLCYNATEDPRNGEGGVYLNTTQFADCGLNCMECSDNVANCTTCKDGTYHNGSSNCDLNCTNNCAVCAVDINGTEECSKCEPNFLFNLAKDTCIGAGTCEANEYQFTNINITLSSGLAYCKACSDKHVDAIRCTLEDILECDGKVVAQDKQSCLDSCPDGQYNHNNAECLTCSSAMLNCKNCTSNTTCGVCETDYTLTHNNEGCFKCSDELTGCVDGQCSNTADGVYTCSSCSSGYNLYDNQTAKSGCYQCSDEIPNCKDTSSSCTQNGSVFTCSECKPGYAGPGSTNKCFLCQVANCETCDNEYSETAQKCDTCAVNFTQSSDQLECFDCNTVVANCDECDGDKLCKVNMCKSGYDLSTDRSECFLCSVANPGCAQCNSDKVCTQCQDGYLLSESKTCEACIVGCKVCSDLSSCDECTTGNHLSLDKSNCELDFEAGCGSDQLQYVDETDGHKVCQLCSDKYDNCLKCEESGDCRECKEGFYGFEADACLTCDQGVSNCKTCPYNREKQTNEILDCTQCIIGFRLDNECSANQWSNVKSLADCGPCKAIVENMGTYNKTCDNYCKAQSMSCVSAGIKTESFDSCVDVGSKKCGDIINEDTAICECAGISSCAACGDKCDECSESACTKCSSGTYLVSPLNVRCSQCTEIGKIIDESFCSLYPVIQDVTQVTDVAFTEESRIYASQKNLCKMAEGSGDTFTVYWKATNKQDNGPTNINDIETAIGDKSESEPSYGDVIEMYGKTEGNKYQVQTAYGTTYYIHYYCQNQHKVNSQSTGQSTFTTADRVEEDTTIVITVGVELTTVLRINVLCTTEEELGLVGKGLVQDEEGNTCDKSVEVNRRILSEVNSMQIVIKPDKYNPSTVTTSEKIKSLTDTPEFTQKIAQKTNLPVLQTSTFIEKLDEEPQVPYFALTQYIDSKTTKNSAQFVLRVINTDSIITAGWIKSNEQFTPQNTTSLKNRMNYTIISSEKNVPRAFTIQELEEATDYKLFFISETIQKKSSEMYSVSFRTKGEEKDAPNTYGIINVAVSSIVVLIMIILALF